MVNFGGDGSSWSDKTQAIGAILAVLAGFLYVAYQRCADSNAAADAAAPSIVRYPGVHVVMPANQPAFIATRSDHSSSASWVGSTLTVFEPPARVSVWEMIYATCCDSSSLTFS